MPTEINNIIHELHAAFESFKTSNDHRLKALESKKSDPIATHEIQRLNDVMDHLTGKIDALRQENTMKAVSDRPFLGDSQHSLEIERKALREYLMTGNKKPLHSLQTKSFNFNDEEGGCFLPNSIQATLDHDVKQISPLMALAQNLESGVGNQIKLIGMNRDSLKNFQGTEAENRWNNVELNNPIQLRYQILAPHYVAFSEKFSLDFMDNPASIDFVANVAALCMGVLSNDGFVNGTGNQCPKGLMHKDYWSYDDAGNQYRVFKSAKESALGEDDTIYNNLMDLMYGLDAPYRENAVFMASSDVIKAMRKVKIGEKYLWSPEKNAFLGKAVCANDAFPAMSTLDKGPHIIFGDFSKGYTILSKPLNIVRDPIKVPGSIMIHYQFCFGGAMSEPKAFTGLHCID